MIINSIGLKNFRIFKSYNKIDLEKGVNFIIGNGSVGKTSVLDAISIFLSYIYFTFDERIGYYGLKPDLKKNLSFYDKEDILSPELDIDINSSKIHMTLSELGLVDSNRKETEEYDSLQKGISSDKCLPLFCYFMNNRKTKVGSKYSGHYERSIYNRREAGYFSVFENSFDYSQIQKFLNIIKKHRKLYKNYVRIESIFNSIVKHFLKEIYGEERLLNVVLESFEYLQKKHSVDEIELNYLGEEERQILRFIIEMAYRVSVLNPNIHNIREQEGIVLIDNIENNMSPNTQWRVIPALTRTFPSVQFIITTNSPIILSSAEEANIVFLSKDKVYQLGDCYGYSVEDTLELKMQSHNKPKEVEEIRKKLDNFLLSENFDGAKKYLDNLKNTEGIHPSLVKVAEEYYRSNSWFCLN